MGYWVLMRFIKEEGNVDGKYYCFYYINSGLKNNENF